VATQISSDIFENFDSMENSVEMISLDSPLSSWNEKYPFKLKNIAYTSVISFFNDWDSGKKDLESSMRQRILSHEVLRDKLCKIAAIFIVEIPKNFGREASPNTYSGKILMKIRRELLLRKFQENPKLLMAY